jgi:hypothetical protein
VPFVGDGVQPAEDRVRGVHGGWFSVSWLCVSWARCDG